MKTIDPGGNFPIDRNCSLPVVLFTACCLICITAIIITRSARRRGCIPSSTAILQVGPAEGVSLSGLFVFPRGSRSQALAVWKYERNYVDKHPTRFRFSEDARTRARSGAGHARRRSADGRLHESR